MSAIITQLFFTAMLSLMHPFYISMTEIEHDKANHTLEISVRIFTDDFEKTIRQTYTGKVDLLNKNEKAHSEKLIQQYISKHLIIKADGKALNVKFDGFESEEGSIWSYLECDNISSLNTLEITNTILYDYRQEQVNFIHVKAGSYDETSKLNYPDNYIKFTLK
ncbi:DUF6702 family protein [Parafilimonas sp.]|uniref:DUF6702 family protein n=1 Tax=Parafilimonas sp. TaxID=1969739 RepID=UPI0039E2AAA3